MTDTTRQNRAAVATPIDRDVHTGCARWESFEKALATAINRLSPDCETVQDGSWPGIAQHVPDDWDLVETSPEGTVGGGFPMIDPDRESELLALAARDGVPIRRDDDLVWSVTLGAGED